MKAQNILTKRMMQKKRFNEFKRTLEYGTESFFPEYVSLDLVEFDDDEIEDIENLDYFEEER